MQDNVILSTEIGSDATIFSKQINSSNNDQKVVFYANSKPVKEDAHSKILDKIRQIFGSDVEIDEEYDDELEKNFISIKTPIELYEQFSKNLDVLDDWKFSSDDPGLSQFVVILG